MLPPDFSGFKQAGGDVLNGFVFHHVGIAVRKISDAIPIFRELFGYEVTSGPFDDPIQKVSVCFLGRGGSDPALELVAPLTKDSPIQLTLKKGISTYHLCYEVPDIRAAIANMMEKGSFLLSGPDPAIAFEQREIAWLMTDADLLVELVQAP